MAAFSRLQVANLTNVKGNGARLRGGVLKADYLGDFYAGYSWSNVVSTTGRRLLNPNTPFLLQFPPEIQKMFLSYLEPIWVLQAEAAFPEIASLTCISNRMWYESLPPVLFTEPEHFQDESHINLNSQLVTPQDGDSRPTPMRGGEFFWQKFTSMNSFVTIPEVKNLSHLSVHVEWKVDVKHLSSHNSNNQHYPRVPVGDDKYRVRNLALGGPFQPQLDYRREHLGALHYGKRCQICYETLHYSLCPFEHAFGVLFCRVCYGKYTLTPTQIQQIPGLDNLIKSAKPNGWSVRQPAANGNHWRPFVDYIVRVQIGVDFETAVAKQQYLTQLLATSRSQSSRARIEMEGHRRQLRKDIVEVVKSYWNSGIGNVSIDATIAFAKATFAPTEQLQRFLFPARSLNENMLCLPYDYKEKWLDDPTSVLASSRIVKSRSFKWKEEAALAMVWKLCDWSIGPAYYRSDNGGTVTAWVKAADEYHLRRVKTDVTVNYALSQVQAGIGFISPASSPNSLHGPGGRHRGHADTRRLQVMLEKLRITPMESDLGSELSDGELDRVKNVFFKKLLHNCCVGCPQNGLLALPRGSVGVIEHFRCAHGRRFWNTTNWNLIG